MKDFINSRIILSDTPRIIYVAPGTGKPVHNNRAKNGIVYYPEGNNIFEFSDATRLSSAENNILFLPKGSSYVVRTTTKSPSKAGCYAINFDTIQPISTTPFAMNIKNSKIENMFVAAEQIMCKKNTGYAYKCQSIFYDIICTLQNEYYSKYCPNSKALKLQPAIDYIKDNYLSETIDIEKLAKLCSVSSVYFRKLFNQVYSLSPIKYINTLKIERAKELIRSDMYSSIDDIAFQSGFNDCCYFRRIFKSKTLMSPIEYKNFFDRK